MVAPFPVVKLGVLVVKQISKPLANFVKRRAVNNKFFRDYICMPPAQSKFRRDYCVSSSMMQLNIFVFDFVTLFFFIIQRKTYFLSISKV